MKAFNVINMTRLLVIGLLISVLPMAAMAHGTTPKALNILDQAPNNTAAFYPNNEFGYYEQMVIHKGFIIRGSNNGGEICTGTVPELDTWDVQGPKNNPFLVLANQYFIPPFDDPSLFPPGTPEDEIYPIAMHTGALNREVIKYKGKDILVVSASICSPGWCSDNECNEFIDSPPAARSHGFYILDVTDPAHPVVLLSTKDNVVDVSTEGGPTVFVYKGKLLMMLASGSPDRLDDYTLLDISDPNNIVKLGGVSIPDLTPVTNGFFRNQSAEVSIFRNVLGRLYMYHPSVDAGMLVVDWTNPSHPKLVKQTLLQPNALDFYSGTPGEVDAANTAMRGAFAAKGGTRFAVTSGGGNSRVFVTASGLPASGSVGNAPGFQGDQSVPIDSYPGGTFTGDLVVSRAGSVSGEYGLNLACTADDFAALPAKSDYPNCTGSNPCILLISRGVCAFNTKAALVTDPAKNWDGILIVSTSSATGAAVNTTVPWLMVDNKYGAGLVADNGALPGDTFHQATLGALPQPYGQIRIMDSLNPWGQMRELAAIGISETLGGLTINESDLGIVGSGGFAGGISYLDDVNGLLYTGWGLGGAIVYDISSCLKFFSVCKPVKVATFKDPTGPWEYNGQMTGPISGFQPIKYKGRMLNAASGRDTTLYLLDEIPNQKDDHKDYDHGGWYNEDNDNDGNGYNDDDDNGRHDRKHRGDD